MSNYSVVQWQASSNDSQSAAAAITAASATEMIQTTARWAWSPAPMIKVGDRFRFEASGIISCVVTTPGTARFDIRTVSGGIVLADTGAMSLNTTAKTNVPWFLTARCRVSAVGSGTSAAIKSWWQFTSEAVVGSASGTALSILVSPGAGAGFDSTITNQLTAFFTQTVATGSMTCQDAAFFMDT